MGEASYYYACPTRSVGRNPTAPASDARHPDEGVRAYVANGSRLEEFGNALALGDIEQQSEDGDWD